MIVRRIYKIIINNADKQEDDKDKFEYEINISKKGISMHDILTIEESNVFEDEGYETIYITLRNGIEFYILANFDNFYKKWIDSKKFNIFANNN